MFGIFFPGKSYPLDITKFCQVDSLHWLLDMGAFVGELLQRTLAS